MLLLLLRYAFILVQLIVLYKDYGGDYCMKAVLCPIWGKRVNCRRDGVCVRAFGDIQKSVCSVYVKALDLTLSCLPLNC